MTLEFRIAEVDPAPGLAEMVFVQTGERFYLHERVAVSQDDVDSAVVNMWDGKWTVEIVLTSAGTRNFEELTENNVGKRCGMVLNGRLVSAPVIMAPIRGGRAIVADNFTEREAHHVARGLSRPEPDLIELPLSAVDGYSTDNQPAAIETAYNRYNDAPIAIEGIRLGPGLPAGLGSHQYVGLHQPPQRGKEFRVLLSGNVPPRHGKRYRVVGRIVPAGSFYKVDVEKWKELPLE